VLRQVDNFFGGMFGNFFINPMIFARLNAKVLSSRPYRTIHVTDQLFNDEYVRSFLGFDRVKIDEKIVFLN